MKKTFSTLFIVMLLVISCLILFIACENNGKGNVDNDDILKNLVEGDDWISGDRIPNNYIIAFSTFALGSTQNICIYSDKEYVKFGVGNAVDLQGKVVIDKVGRMQTWDEIRDIINLSDSIDWFGYPQYAISDIKISNYPYNWDTFGGSANDIVSAIDNLISYLNGIKVIYDK